MSEVTLLSTLSYRLPHEVEVPAVDWYWYPIVGWCRENIGSEFYLEEYDLEGFPPKALWGVMRPTEKGLTFRFNKLIDATHFKLRWVGSP